MNQDDIGIIIGVIVISLSIISGVAVVFASMRSSQISRQEEKNGQDPNRTEQ